MVALASSLASAGLLDADASVSSLFLLDGLGVFGGIGEIVLVNWRLTTLGFACLLF